MRNALDLKHLGDELDRRADAEVGSEHVLTDRYVVRTYRECADIAYEESIRRLAKEMRYSPDAARRIGVTNPRLRDVAKRMLASRAGSCETKELQ